MLLQATPRKGASHNSYLPIARSSYVLMKEKCEVFVEQVRALQTPTHYVSQLRKRVNVNGHIKGLKSLGVHYTKHVRIYVSAQEG